MMYVAQIYLTADSGRQETTQIQEAVRRCGALAPDFEEDHGQRGKVAEVTKALELTNELLGFFFFQFSLFLKSSKLSKSRDHRKTQRGQRG